MNVGFGGDDELKSLGVGIAGEVDRRLVAVGSWRKRVRWVLGVYWVLLAVATHVRQFSVDGLPGVGGLPLDKAMHVCAFAGLAALLVWSRWWPRRSWAFNAAAAVGIGLVYGVVEEGTQPWFGRTGSGWDLLADAVGLLLGAGVAWGVERWVVFGGGAHRH